VYFVDNLTWEVVTDELSQLMTTVSHVNSTLQLISTLEYSLTALHHAANHVRLIHCHTSTFWLGAGLKSGNPRKISVTPNEVYRP